MSANSVSKKSEPRSGELSLKSVGLPETSPDRVLPIFGIGGSVGGPTYFEAFFSSLSAVTDQRIAKDGVRIGRHRLDQWGRVGVAIATTEPIGESLLLGTGSLEVFHD